MRRHRRPDGRWYSYQKAELLIAVVFVALLIYVLLYHHA